MVAYLTMVACPYREETRHAASVTSVLPPQVIVIHARGIVNSTQPPLPEPPPPLASSPLRLGVGCWSNSSWEEGDNGVVVRDDEAVAVLEHARARLVSRYNVVKCLVCSRKFTSIYGLRAPTEENCFLLLFLFITLKYSLVRYIIQYI